MSEETAIRATLQDYYNAIGSHDFDTIPSYFTTSMTLITLSGCQPIEGAQSIAELYRNLWQTWSAQGISTEMSYSPESFEILPVQQNCKLAKTQLTNFDFDGNQLQTWNCTYVMVREGGRWLINLVTSDNGASADLQMS